MIATQVTQLRQLTGLTILDSCISHMKTSMPFAVHLGFLFVFLAAAAPYCSPFAHKSRKLYADEASLLKIQRSLDRRLVSSAAVFWDVTQRSPQR